MCECAGSRACVRFGAERRKTLKQHRQKQTRLMRKTMIWAAMAMAAGAWNAEAQVNLANGLVAYYPLNGNGQDASGNGNNGSVSGGVTWVADQWGNPGAAAQFGGTGNPGKITVPHSATLNFSTGATFAFWVRVNSATGTSGTGQVVTGGSQCMFAKEGDAGGGLWNNCSITGGSNFNHSLGNNGMSSLAGTWPGYTLGTWFHYAVTMDATGYRTYINGQLQTQNEVAANFSAMVNRALVLGRFNSNWYPLNGVLDEFRVYNRVLTQVELEALADNDLGGLTIANNGPTSFCAGQPVSVVFGAEGDFAPTNEFRLQMSDGNGSFALPSILATSTEMSGTLSGEISVGVPSGNNYRLRLVSTAPVMFSEPSEPFTVSGTIGNIPTSGPFYYIGSVGGRHFYRSTNQLNRAGALASCANNGGYLATVRNQETNVLFHAANNGQITYIGLNDLVTEGLYQWVNGEPLTYLNWHSGEPNNSGNEDVVEMYGTTGTWNDVSGSTARRYIMELAPAGLDFSVCEGSPIALIAAPLAGATYQWTGPNGFSSNQQNPTIPNATPANEGVYTLTYTLNGCSGSAQVFVRVNQRPSDLGQTADLPASLSEGLLLHYMMDGNANDASGNGLNGNMVGGVTPIADRFGSQNSALQLNGTNGHLTAPAGVYFNGSAFTVNAWVRKVSNANWSRLFDFGNGPTNNNVLLALTNGTTGRPQGTVYHNAVSVGDVLSPSATVANNQWVMLSFVNEGNGGRIFLNGSMIAQDVQASPIDILRTINYIGRSNWSQDQYANAAFDDLRIYNRALSLSEIRALLLYQPEPLTAETSPEICTGTAATILLHNTQPGVSYQMQNAQTLANVGGAQTGTGGTLTFVTGNLTQNTEFHFVVTHTLTGCQSITQSVAVGVPAAPVAPVTEGFVVCNEGSGTLTATGATEGGSYLWYTVPVGGAPLPGQTGPTLEVGNINGSVTYYVSVVNSAGCESTRTLVTAGVNNPLNPPVDIVSGLILHYTFDSTLNDFSGFNSHGTVFGNHSYVNDKDGNPHMALNSTSTGTNNNNYVTSGNPAQVQQLTNQVTISAWIRQTQTWFGSDGFDGQMPLINKWNGSTGLWMGLRMINPSNMSNRIRWRVNGTTFIESNTNVPVGQWHHVVCTYNGAQLRIYQNGVLTGTLNHTGSIGNTGVDLMLGRQANGVPAGGITYRGDWDEVKMWNRALNPSEVQTLFNDESVAFANTPFCDEEGNLTLTTFEFPGATYQWAGPNGFTSTEQNPPVISGAQAGVHDGFYSLVVTKDGCESPVQTVNAIIYEFPDAPETTDDTVCGSGNAALTATGAPAGASYRWYTVPVGGTPIGGQTSGTLVIPNLNQTTSRWVSIVANGCEGERSEAIAFYYNVLQTALPVDGSNVCTTEEAALVTVTGSEAGVLYQAFLGNQAVSSAIVGGGNLMLLINTIDLILGDNLISIKATAPGCGEVTLDNIAIVSVLPGPSAAITPNGSLNLCAGETVTLSAPAGLTYLWSTNEQTSAISVSAAGTYTVMVTDMNGCFNTSAPAVVTVTELPVPSISANGPTTFCPGGSVVLTATGGQSYLWSTGQTGSQITVSASGSYSFTANNGNCAAQSQSVEVTLLTAPQVTAMANLDVVCPGTAVVLTGGGAQTYTWSGGVTNGVAFVPAQTTNYTVTGTDANGCTGTSTITVTVLPAPNSTFTSNVVSLCPGTDVATLIATPGMSQYHWTLNGEPLEPNGPTELTVNQPGTYGLIVTDGNGCQSSSTLSIQAGESPSVSLSAAGETFCAGSNSLLTANAIAGATYTWFLNGNQVAGPAVGLNTFNASQTGTYHVSVTNAGGCAGQSETVTLTAVPGLEAVISASGTTICPGDNVVLTAQSVTGATYQWFLNNQPISGATASQHTATVGGNYHVVVNDGCPGTSNSISISVSPLPGNAGSISGWNSLCAGESEVFSISNVPNATSYQWLISPPGAASISVGQGTNSVNVNPTNLNFTLTVTPQNACGQGNTSTLNVQVTTGTFCSASVMFAANQTLVCTGQQVVFTNYTQSSFFPGTTPQWNFGAGASPATANGNGPHAVTYSTTGMKTVTLNYVDMFGFIVDSEVKTNYISVSGGINTGPISGPNSVSCAANSAGFSVTATPGSTYQWTVPSGATILSGQGTASVSINPNGNAGNVTVTETNAAGCSGAPVTFSYTLTGLPQTGPISGPALVSCDSQNELYSVAVTTGSDYQWTVPSGATILSGQGTAQIAVNFNSSFGSVSVTETNAEGCQGSAQTIEVSCQTGVEESEDTLFAVFPNPTRDVFTVIWSAGEMPAILVISDAGGRQVKTQRIVSGEQISVSGMASGLYFGMLHTESGTRVFRLIVQ
jgi:hypothetical protein